MLLVEADGAGVVLVDEEVEPARRQAFGFIDQRAGNVRTPEFGRHHDLIKIHRLVVDGDEAGELAVDLRQHDMRDRDQLLAPALAPPGRARVEVDVRIVLRPGAPPQFDRGVLVGRRIGAEDGGVHHALSAAWRRSLRAIVTTAVRSQLRAP